MKQALTIMWFSQDLRLADNPALTAAIKVGAVLPIYIFDHEAAGEHRLGAASNWWLHHSLGALDASLDGGLNLYSGSAWDIISDLCDRYNIEGVFWNRRYEPWQISRDTQIKQQLLIRGIDAASFNGSLLHEPWKILKKDGTPYKVFTPYHRQASILDETYQPLPPPVRPIVLEVDGHAKPLKTFSLLPKIPWDTDFYDLWAPGEHGAKESLTTFLSKGIDDYKDGRDYPSLKTISKLSPHMHFGEVSPGQVVESLLSVPEDNNSEHFKRELRWREFSYYLLFHWPKLPTENLKQNLTCFTWNNDPSELKKWQQGKTGYPLIDAGMRELWKTGFMHNRVRMITASFLVKNLLIDWRLGASWFWDCLVDADLASNSASWQWVAGCGTDASPYFRIFNPVTQGEKFDADGDYTRRHVPELKDLPKKYLFRPWEAPTEVLKKANVILGETYPYPMVDTKESRLRALSTYEAAKQYRSVL